MGKWKKKSSNGTKDIRSLFTSQAQHQYKAHDSELHSSQSTINNDLSSTSNSLSQEFPHDSLQDEDISIGTSIPQSPQQHRNTGDNTSQIPQQDTSEDDLGTPMITGDNDVITASGSGMAQCSNSCEENSSSVIVPPCHNHSLNLIEVAIKKTRVLTESEKYKLLTTSPNEKIPHNQTSSLDYRYFPYKRGSQQRKISFQRKWLEQHTWLFYGGCVEKGGWCLPCIIFLTDSEKVQFKSFVNTPFVNYNKSTEILARHCKNVYHLRAVQRSYTFKASYSNPEIRIDSRLTDTNHKNFLFNSEILPVLVEAVLTCARQKVALQGHKQDKIDFSKPPCFNEGNFIAILRLLAKTNSTLQAHLVSGPKNAKYISKTIQNEILEIAATQIRQFYRDCLMICPHFSLIADEVTSHGKEILSVCLRFLEVRTNTEFVAKKHEVLLDFHFLERITGEKIAEGILKVLECHEIDVTKCRGQAYDTTASMSSSRSGVQAHIQKLAPDAIYQGCVLHSLNLVICNSSKISSIRNMIDSCHQAFLFFDNSPKRQRFLEMVIKCFCPNHAKKVKINGLCKTRWIERHTTFTAIFELYPYLVQTWNEICHPSDEEQLYPEGNHWNWDSESRSYANGLRHTFCKFEHIFVFLIAKELLEPIRPIAECLQGRLQEVYFGFKKVDEVKEAYKRMREHVSTQHNSVYSKALKLADDIGSNEDMPRILKGRQTMRSNPDVTSPKDYWKVTVTIPFLDSIVSELECRFAPEKQAHYELCSLIPEIITKKDESDISDAANLLASKWTHLMPSSDNFESELRRWKVHCESIREPRSVTSLLKLDADSIFYPNVRELLCILAVLPIGSTEAERSFSCLRQIHTWLRTTMTSDRLGNLGVIGMQGFNYEISIEKCCEQFKLRNPRKMTCDSVLFN